MKIYPTGYKIEEPKLAPIENDPTAVEKARARIKAEMAKGKPADADHIVSVLASEGLLSGLVDVYAVIADGGADWKTDVVAAEPVAVEK